MPLGLLKADRLQLFFFFFFFFCFFFCFSEACLLPPLAPAEPVLNSPRDPPAPPPPPLPAPDAPSSSGADATSSSSCPLRKPPMSSPVALRFVAVERSPAACAHRTTVRLQRCKQSRRNQ